MRAAEIIRLHADRALAIVFATVGAILLVAGWAGASRTAFPAEQLPYLLSGGLGGLFLLVIGVAAWVSADLRDEWRKLDSIDEALRDLAGTTLVADGAPDLDHDPAPRPDHATGRQGVA